MEFGTPRNQRHNPRDAEFGALFNRPLHAIELEHGENQRDLGQDRTGNLFAQLKIDAIVAYRCDSSATDHFAGGNVEILSDARSEHTHEMIGMLANYRGA